MKDCFICGDFPSFGNGDAQSGTPSRGKSKAKNEQQEINPAARYIKHLLFQLLHNTQLHRIGFALFGNRHTQSVYKNISFLQFTFVEKE